MLPVYAGIIAQVADGIRWLADNFGGYGWAMILLGVITKVALIPFYQKQLEHMRDMKIQPYLKELQEKYKDDQEELTKRTLELFKQHNINPLGGCLVALLQFPILIVIYRAIYVAKSSFEGIGFLWIKDLSKPDLLLFLIYMVSMYFSFELTPTYGDKEEKVRSRSMNLIMLLLFSFIFYKFPSAFILYWLSFNLTSMIHTGVFWLMNLKPSVQGGSSSLGKDEG